MDALVLSTKWQEGEEPVREVGGVISNASGLVDAVLVVGQGLVERPR